MKGMILIILSLLLACGCSANVILHDENKAIETTNSFLRSLIKEDYNSAYNNFISDLLKKNLQFERFDSDFRASNEVRGELIKAIFESYQSVPGQKAIQLYYNVTHEKAGEILYHFVLEGDGIAGYKIIVVDIGNQMQYPPNIKYVGVKRIKKDEHIEVTSE